jgi:hypothetical protein
MEISNLDQAKCHRTDWTDSRDWKEEIKLQVVENEKHAAERKLSQSAHGQCWLSFQMGDTIFINKNIFPFFLFCYGDKAKKK